MGHINERYFGLEGLAVAELKQRYYVIGATYSMYSPLGENGVIFRSRHRSLAELVKEQLQSGNAIRPNGKNSYFIQHVQATDLRSYLRQMGIVEDRSQRTFPYGGVPNEFMDHFFRGFIDATARFYIFDGKVKIQICYNAPFVKDLHIAIKRLTKIEREEPKSKVNLYSHYDVVKLTNFMYSDWGFIEKCGLYAPENKKFLDEGIADKTASPSALTNQRIEQAKTLLLDHTATEVARMLNMSLWGFTCAFKRRTKKTTKQFKYYEERRRRLLAPIMISTIGSMHMPSGSYESE